MDEEIKRYWVAALRSGQYEVGQGVLRQKTQDGRILYDALGVLSEVYRLGHGGEWADEGVASWESVNWSEAPHGNHFYSLYGDAFSLPFKVGGWARTGWANISLREPSPYNDVAEANDAGVSFAELADLIEKYA